MSLFGNNYPQYQGAETRCIVCHKMSTGKVDVSYAQTEALMELLNKVALPEDAKKRGSTSFRKSFRLNCELFIRFAVQHLRAMPPNWSAFFYTRMQQSQSVLSREYITEKLIAYHHYHGWFNTHKNSEYAMVAESLVKFFRTHLQDPDNSLIGLRPNGELFSNFYERSADGKKYRLPRDVEPVRIQIPLPVLTSSSSLLTKITRRKRGNTNLATSAPDLTEVPSFAPGDVVIWCKHPLWQPHHLVYARVADYSDEESVLLYYNPSETESELVPLSQVVPLHPQMEENILDIRTLPKLVSDPLDLFFKKMTEQVKEQTNKFLIANGIDTTILQDIIDRSEKNQKLLSMRDLPILVNINEKFQKWKEIAPGEFYNRIDEDCSMELQKLQKNPPDGAFQPTLLKSFEDLEKVKFSQLAMSRINRFMGNCETVLGYLFLEKTEFLNGTRKNTLTAWWLGKIDTTARKFLANREYDDDAIPVDYISEPPADLEPIKKNLQIIENILNPTDGNTDGKDLANTLKVEIYEKINAFIADCSIIIADVLHFNSENFSVAFAEEKLKEEKEQLDESLFKCISDMIKDVDYLLEMQEMENPAKQVSGGGLVLSNVVPVSGLIMSTFFRRENVLRTILELYDYKPKPKENPIVEAQPNSESKNNIKRRSFDDANELALVESNTLEVLSSTSGENLSETGQTKSRRRPTNSQTAKLKAQEGFKRGGFNPDVLESKSSLAWKDKASLLLARGRSASSFVKPPSVEN